MSDSAPVIAIADAKWQLSLTDNAEDAQIERLIAAAIDHVERYTGLLLSEREVTETFDRFAGLRLKAWPIASDAAVAISYLDISGATQPQTTYRLAAAARPALLLPAIGSVWPATHCGTGSVRATFMAGYVDADAVPASIKQAILLLVRHYYDNRSAVEVGTSVAAEGLPMGVAMLLSPHRLRTV